MVTFISRALQGLSVGLFGLLLLGLLPTLRAQGPETIGLRELDSEVSKKETRDLVLKLLRGDIAADPANPAHKDAMDVHARDILFRYHYDDYHDPMTRTGKTIEKLNRDFENDLSSLSRNPAKAQSTYPIYTKSMIDQGKLVLQSNKNIARVGAARCLGRLAELEQPFLVDFYTGVLREEGQIDAVKYFMVRGLGDLLALSNVKDPTFLQKADREKAAKALAEFIRRPPTFPPGVSEQEVRGFRILRREAVRALGNARVPTLADKTRPGLELLRVLGNEGMIPPAQFDEQIEAAIALGQMNPTADKDFNPDYAAQQIGRFVIPFTAFTLNDNKTYRLPCKVYSARLLESLELLTLRCQDLPMPVKDYVGAVTKAANPVLRALREDNPNATLINRFVSELEKILDAGAPNKSLYKDLPDSVLKGGN